MAPTMITKSISKVTRIITHAGNETGHDTDAENYKKSVNNQFTPKFSEH